MSTKILTAFALSLIMASGAAFAGDGSKKEGKKKAELEERFAEADTNKDGQLSKDEFIAYMKEKHKEKKDGKDGKKDKKEDKTVTN